LFMSKIDEFVWVRADPLTGASVEQPAIKDGQSVDGLTSLVCDASGCSFQSMLQAAFFVEKLAVPSTMPSLMPTGAPTPTPPTSSPTPYPTPSPTISFQPSISQRPTPFPTISAQPSKSASPTGEPWELVAHMSNLGGMFDGQTKFMPNAAFGLQRPDDWYDYTPKANEDDFKWSFNFWPQLIKFVTGDNVAIFQWQQVWAAIENCYIPDQVSGVGVVVEYMYGKISEGEFLTINPLGNILSQCGNPNHPMINLGQQSCVVDAACPTLIWGENDINGTTGWTDFKNTNEGTNVYIMRPWGTVGGPDGNIGIDGWSLVAHMSNLGNMFGGQAHFNPNAVFGPARPSNDWTPEPNDLDFKWQFPFYPEQIKFVTGDNVAIFEWDTFSSVLENCSIPEMNSGAGVPVQYLYGQISTGTFNNAVGNILNRCGNPGDPFIDLGATSCLFDTTCPTLIWTENDLQGTKFNTFKNANNGTNVYIFGRPGARQLQDLPTPNSLDHISSRDVGNTEEGQLVRRLVDEQVDSFMQAQRQMQSGMSIGGFGAATVAFPGGRKLRKVSFQFGTGRRGLQELTGPLPPMTVEIQEFYDPFLDRNSNEIKDEDEPTSPLLLGSLVLFALGGVGCGILVVMWKQGKFEEEDEEKSTSSQERSMIDDKKSSSTRSSGSSRNTRSTRKTRSTRSSGHQSLV
jgi:hypothetical protein